MGRRSWWAVLYLYSRAWLCDIVAVAVEAGVWAIVSGRLVWFERFGRLLLKMPQGGRMALRGCLYGGKIAS